MGLVDEWLTDEKTIPNIEERRKEGQVIINNLCAYIRSPFLLAERAEQLDKPYAKYLQKDFDGDKEKFDADKRSFARDKAVLEEERQVRLSIIKEMHEHLHNTEKPGPWSGFDYDFSNAHFFYLTLFTSGYFDALSYFHGATFTQDASFCRTTFTGYARFSGAKFTKDANFSGATFTRDTDFTGAKFTENADFSKVEFTETNFTKAKFTWSADFSQAKFAENADFSQAKFTRKADFSEAKFDEKPIFEYALDSETYKARFSHKANPEDYNFEVSDNSRYKIETEEKEYDGAKFIIPKGAELFNPDKPSEQGNNDGN